MKYIRTYEMLKVKTIPTVLTTGDIVKCIDDNGTKILTLNKIYTIFEVINVTELGLIGFDNRVFYS